MAYKQTKTRAQREKEIREEEARLSALVETGQTASGRNVGETLSKPSAKHYGYYLEDQREVMRGKSDLASMQKARRNAFYARNYLRNNAEKYDKERWDGAAQEALAHIDRTLG